MSLLDRMTDMHGEDPSSRYFEYFENRALRISRLVLDYHDREHVGVARWCDTQACREAWEILL